MLSVEVEAAETRPALRITKGSAALWVLYLKEMLGLAGELHLSKTSADNL
jgi:hypothetical protein